jgi:hypothetical protein
MDKENPEINLALSGAIKIVFGLFIIILITIYLVSRYLKIHISENIDDYKCKPLIMPFVKYFQSDIDPEENFKKCTEKNSRKYFKDLADPIIKVTESTTNATSEVAESINVLSQGVSYVGDSVVDKLDTSTDSLTKLNGTLHYVLIKFKSFFDKMGILMYDVYNALVSVMDMTNIILALPEIVMNVLGFMIMVFGIIIVLLIMFFVITMILGNSFTALGAALMTNPFTVALGITFTANGILIIQSIAIGVYMSAVLISTIFLGILLAVYIPLKSLFDSANKASYCCFGADTKIKLNALKFDRISNIQPNQILANDIRVYGVMHVIFPDKKELESNWYKIGNIHDNTTLVSGNHLVYLRNDRKKVADLKKETHFYNSELVEGNDISKLQKYGTYSLITSNNVISTSTYDFSDHQEHPSCSSELTHALKYFFKSNSINLMPLLEFGESFYGFKNTTYVKMYNGTYRRLKDVEIGDVLFNNNKIIGYYNCIDKCQYVCQWNNLLVPCNLLFLDENGHKQKIYNITKPLKNKGSDEILVNLITSQNTFVITDSDCNSSVSNELIVYDFISAHPQQSQPQSQLLYYSSNSRSASI